MWLFWPSQKLLRHTTRPFYISSFFSTYSWLSRKCCFLEKKRKTGFSLLAWNDNFKRLFLNFCILSNPFGWVITFKENAFNWFYSLVAFVLKIWSKFMIKHYLLFLEYLLLSFRKGKYYIFSFLLIYWIKLCFFDYCIINISF